ncbi:MAG: FtsW/RodA/SpoVE family cell cycle protein, partial [Anaerolineae bacterium]|nr:FtsW/RodA/SpoVE family cell cycle protein [Anaerolineae bacterium]
MMFKKAKREALGPPDWILLFTTLAIIALGLMMVYSSTSDLGYRDHGDAAHFFRRQLTWLLIGFVAMIIAMRIPYRHWT